MSEVKVHRIPFGTQLCDMVDKCEFDKINLELVTIKANQKLNVMGFQDTSSFCAICFSGGEIKIDDKARGYYKCQNVSCDNEWVSGRQREENLRSDCEDLATTIRRLELKCKMLEEQRNRAIYNQQAYLGLHDQREISKKYDAEITKSIEELK